jgi:pyruvate dehydrogenase E2 component (dihydrolipoamide acetyltransferase)
MANIVEMPKLGFDMAEGKLVAWIIAENNAVEKGDVLAEIETDKATVEVESSFSGIVHKHLVSEGDALPVGTPIAVIAQEGESVNLNELLGDSAKVSSEKEIKPDKSASIQEPGFKKEQKSMGQDLSLKASPVAKRIAEENNLDLSLIKGSGPGGRIVKRDVTQLIETGTARSDKPVHDEINFRKDETFTISKLREAIGKRMQASCREIPHFYVTVSYDIAEILKTRKQMNDGLSKEDRISVNDFIIRASALALKHYPNLNASISEKEVTHHGDINIGVAVAVDNGLLTVVIRNADQKSLKHISGEAKQIIQRVKSGKVRTKDIQGSTFTISNLGMFDVEDFVAIINPPEAAILAVGSAREVPVVVDGELAIGSRLKATLSADHRITDGAEAAQFMQHLKLYLEQPWRLFA